ncbi:MAG: winged helix-turn-helix transcriptional regulator, partial [Nanoarchaeota archaeon]
MDKLSLDSLDRKIISELFHNARMSNSELGKRLHTSKEVINYRINRLTKEGIIKKFIPLIDFSRLGYTIYRIQLKFRNKDKKDWEEFFKSIRQTSWIVELQGNWDLVVLFWIKNNLEFFEIVNQIQEHYKDNIQDQLITIVDSICHFPPNFILSTRKEPFYYKIGTSKEKVMEIDEVKSKIIRELTKNGRIPILNMARNIGYSATNINHHLKKGVAWILAGVSQLIKIRKP